MMQNPRFIRIKGIVSYETLSRPTHSVPARGFRDRGYRRRAITIPKRNATIKDCKGARRVASLTMSAKRRLGGASRSLGVLFYVGIAVAVAQALWHWRLIRDRTREGCFKAFRLNHWLGFTVFAGVVAGYAVR